MGKKHIALRSQEGSVIATRSREGWFPTEPPRRFAPPLLTQEGEFTSSLLLIYCVSPATCCVNAPCTIRIDQSAPFFFSTMLAVPERVFGEFWKVSARV